MNIKVLQLQKRASHEYQYIQDKYNYSITNSCIALSDGTTQSFKSELWAKMIVDDFVINPAFDVTILKNQFKNLAIDFKNTAFEYSTNFAKAALEKDKQKNGGTGTFFGLQFINDNIIKVINCGDTCLFIIRDDKIIPFPFKNLDELDKNDYFINSTKLIEGTIQNNFFNTDELKVEKSDKIIVATDAISRLIYRKPEILHSLLNINNFEELKHFCTEYWENKMLEEDDISIIIISPYLSDKIIEIAPPDNFTFPKEEEIEFIPLIENNNYSNDIATIQMEQQNRMIQQLFNETNFLKNKLKLIQVLLISALLLLVLNTGLLFYFVNNINGINFIKENSNMDSPQNETNTPIKESINNSSTKKDIIKKDDQADEAVVSSQTINKKDSTKNKTNIVNTPLSTETVSKKVSTKKMETPSEKVLPSPIVVATKDSIKK